MVAVRGRGRHAPRTSPRTVAVGVLLIGLTVSAAPALGVTFATGATTRGLPSADGAAPVAPPVLVPLVGGLAPDSTGGTPAPSGSGGDAAASGSPASESAPASGSASPSSVSGSGDLGLGAALDPDAVTGELDPLLSGGALGSGRTPAVVVDVATGEVLYSTDDQPTTPASTMKLVTALSALDALGADAMLSTRTVILDPAAKTPRVVIVGAGDPSLTWTDDSVGGAGTSVPTSSVRDLAERTAQALRARGIDTVRIGYDDSLFTGPGMHPSWSDEFPALGVVAPVSALVVDQGRRTTTATARSGDPAAFAADLFAEELERAGIEVRGNVKHVTERAESEPLAQVESAPVGMLVERMLATSDNDYAENLARLAAEATGHPASFDGVSARAAEVLTARGIDVAADRFADGSGLSRENELAPSTLTDLLQLSSTEFGDIPSGLSVAGVNGSLHARYDTKATTPARGLVRAKTGTLTGVAGLAGYASREDGRLLAFAVLDDDVAGGARDARAQIDRAVTALVTCDCAVD